MQKGKFFTKIGFFISALLVSVFLIAGFAEVKENVSDVSIHHEGSGLILIDSIGNFGDLSRPPVAFSHDQHTNLLLKLDFNCTTCHMEDDGGKLSLKFKRLNDTDRKTVMQTYHTNCISCHRDNDISKKKGPVTCGGCHSDKGLRLESFCDPIRFDKYLHYTHVKANDEKCELCHHEYDKKSKKLIYKKGSENACSYCHLIDQVERTITMKEASHESCIRCHIDKKNKKMISGPITCGGCHDLSMQQDTIKKNKDIPRMDRGQPNVIMVKTKSEDCSFSKQSIAMGEVPFDHKSHEQYNNTCNVCHHSSLESCSKCHTNKSNDDDKQIRLIDAMHSINSTSSCIGCHKSKQGEAQCAGCHLEANLCSELPSSSCDKCHMLDNLPDIVGCVDNENRSKELAENCIRDRVFKGKKYSKEDIPESITIDSLSQDYKAVILPHRKIVFSLLDRISNSKLATYFHGDEGVLCLGCHHNSPISNKPPACGNCHGGKKDVTIPYRPGLISAYHQQCIRCHDAMGLDKPNSRNCTTCHAKKDAIDNN